jgi:fatty acid/phospholipid biosynthesis enzyme
VTLNDTQFVEASRALGERLAKHAGDDDAKLRWAFLEVVSRPPSTAELAVTRKALARERARYADAARAAAVLAVGESPRDATLPAGEHAAWMQVATLLLNLSEAVTRN